MSASVLPLRRPLAVTAIKRVGSFWCVSTLKKRRAPGRAPAVCELSYAGIASSGPTSSTVELNSVASGDTTSQPSSMEMVASPEPT